ncbi:MAG: aldehyde dehydrogenase family protein [Bradyrhizobium sp.]|nr:aldehyde dehydrogenase family protein [Bradyrhizobium sp.]
MQTIHSFIDGATVEASTAFFTLTSPVEEKTQFSIADGNEDLAEKAVRSAHQAFQKHARVPTLDRVNWLNAAADTLNQHVDAIAELLVMDIGKPIRLARIEVTRGVQFLRACAVQLQTLGGETIPMDTTQQGLGHFGYTRRIPYGVVAAVTPFNAPVNLLIQKVAPAIAAGNAVVVKPHPAGTRAAIAVAKLFIEAGLPVGLFNVLTGDRAPAVALVKHPLVRAVSFTGGTAAGDALAAAAGAKKFVAELGSNAANIVLKDADLADAAKRIAAAGFEASGQQCVSAQRVIVDAAVYDQFVPLLVTAAQALKVGDPREASTDVGPMVSHAAAVRVMAMAASTTQRGAYFALEPHQDGCTVSPGILVEAAADSDLWTKEVFGPLVVVCRANDTAHALALANDSPFGLQGAVFTKDIGAAFLFAEQFDVGSMWVNEASRFRLDTYPFGGVKNSGYGREGVRYAIEDLSQIKFIGIRPV